MSNGIALNSEVYDHHALVQRLGEGLRGSHKDVVFVVGSGLSAPRLPGEPGVPMVSEVIKLIEQEFDHGQIEQLRAEIEGAANPYQQAFLFLQGRRGQTSVNEVIRKAVIQARRISADGSQGGYSITGATSESLCKTYDDDWAGWHLSPGMEALGQLASSWPERFGKSLLTTNFDPLVGAAIQAAKGSHFRTVLHRDGNLRQTSGVGTHIVHLHGYWYGSDTLHTPRQLNQARPQLRASLSGLMRDSVLVILGYGGWDDVFTKTLLEVVADDGAFPEVIWTFRDKNPHVRPALHSMLDPGIDRGNVTFYAGIDAHTFLPDLVAEWDRMNPVPSVATRHVESASSLAASLHIESLEERQVDQQTTEPPKSERGPSVREQQRRLRALSPDDGRPPELAVYVGRQADLARLQHASFRTAFITGPGGLGKSALAAAYFESATVAASFDHRIWRDCREQGFRFEDHVLSIVRALAPEDISANELARLSVEELARLFVQFTRDLKLLMVFDNVDHHIDLVRRVLVGAPERFLTTLSEQGSQAQIIFTCRPHVTVEAPDTVNVQMDGLPLQGAVDLFRLRGASLDAEFVQRVHASFGGNALWLDIIAAHSASGGSPLTFVNTGGTPAVDPDENAVRVLRPIWQVLESRPKMVLQLLAETIHPTTLVQISDYFGPQLRYAKAKRATEQLKSLNLVVVKRQDDGEAYDLHPLVRNFVQKTHKVSERANIIDLILAAQRAVLDMYRPQLSARPPAAAVRSWLEAAELNLNAGRMEPALIRMQEVSDAASNEAPVEFTRVASMAFARGDLEDLAAIECFDDVFSDYIRMLVMLGRTDAASIALDDYEATLEGKDARYINLCDMRCHLHWMNRNNTAAIRWGTEGVELKRESNVDTAFDCSHNLALAQRDAGLVEPALTFFLDGRVLDDVISPDTIEADRNESFYGNIGRCLHFMGQISPALSCYRKSAQILQKAKGAHLVENQGFIRQWIGELLKAQGRFQDALAFFIAARIKWELVSPPHSERLTREIEQLVDNRAMQRATRSQAEQFVAAWISDPVSTFST